MHWLLARLRRLFPALSQRAAIAAVFDRHLTPDTIAGECAYLARPEARAFERTYGWAWLLELAHELQRAADPDARRWSRVLDPLARAFVQRYLDYLPQETYPLRMGIHPNSAFGLQFAFEYARAIGMAELEALCIERTRAWYLNDRDAPAAWEPSGSDFCRRRSSKRSLSAACCRPATSRNGCVHFYRASRRANPRRCSCLLRFPIVPTRLPYILTDSIFPEHGVGAQSPARCRLVMREFRYSTRRHPLMSLLEQWDSRPTTI